MERRTFKEDGAWGRVDGGDNKRLFASFGEKVFHKSRCLKE